MIEEYADQAACDSHFNTPNVQRLVKTMGSSPPVLTGAPEIYNLAPSTDFKRPAEPDADTLMILAHFEYKAGKSTDALKGWNAFSNYCKEKEKETLGYCVTEDKANNTIRTVEVYKDAEFVSEVHVKSEAVKANQEQNGSDRTGKKGAVKLRIVQGFLGK
jgi:quinol monooxygenase YgiN